jgi:pimeloyl-ACP methyl ester carboxylesterase
VWFLQFVIKPMIAARALYARVTAPVDLIYSDDDWSRPAEREANLALLPDARSITLPDTGHFAALEQPARVAEILTLRGSPPDGRATTHQTSARAE